MMLKIPLYESPVPSTEFINEANLCGSILRFDYIRNGQSYKSGLKFNYIYAIRRRAERCCSVWHIENTYDTLTEILNSDWIIDIFKDTQKHFDFKGKHYMIYLDSFGCLEAIANSWEILPEEFGEWQDG